MSVQEESSCGLKEKQGDRKEVGERVKRLLFMPRRKENNVLGLLSLFARVNCVKCRQGPIAENWIHVKMRKGVNGGFEAGKDSRRERREAERTLCRAPRFAKKKDDGRAEASTKVRSRVCKTENEAGRQETGRRRKAKE